MRNTAYLKVGFLGIILFLCFMVHNATASDPEDPCACPEDVTVGGRVDGELFWSFPASAWDYGDGQEKKGIFLDNLDTEYTLFYHEDNRVPVNTTIALFTNKRFYEYGVSFYKSGDTDVWDWREECGLGSWSIGYFCYIKNLYMDGVLQTIGTISNDERYAVGWITPSTPGIKNMTAELDDSYQKDYEIACGQICESSPGNWWYLYYNDPTWTTIQSQPLVVIDGWINDNQGCLDVLEYDPDGTNDEVEISFTVEPQTGWCPDEAWLRFSRVGGGGTIEFLLYRRVDEGNDIISSAWDFREFKWHGKAPDPNNPVIEGDYVMPAGVYEVELILEFGAWKIPGVYNFIKSKQDGTKKEIILTEADLDIVGVSDEDEEDPGKYIAWNNDDDNNDLTEDWDEDHQVVGEDDLVQITLYHVNYLPDDEYIYLKEIGASGKLKVWTTQDKQANINVSGDGHGYLNSELPKTLWVEGFQASDAVRDAGLRLYWSCGVKEIKDDIRFSVYYVDLKVRPSGIGADWDIAAATGAGGKNSDAHKVDVKTDVWPSFGSILTLTGGGGAPPYEYTYNSTNYTIGAQTEVLCSLGGFTLGADDSAGGGLSGQTIGYIRSSNKVESVTLQLQVPYVDITKTVTVYFEEGEKTLELDSYLIYPGVEHEFTTVWTHHGLPLNDHELVVHYEQLVIDGAAYDFNPLYPVALSTYAEARFGENEDDINTQTDANGQATGILYLKPEYDFDNVTYEVEDYSVYKE